MTMRTGTTSLLRAQALSLGLIVLVLSILPL
jgi:hypothetical protein